MTLSLIDSDNTLVSMLENSRHEGDAQVTQLTFDWFLSLSDIALTLSTDFYPNTPVTPNSFSQRAENGMLPENFEHVQSYGRPSPFSKFILRSVSSHTV